MQRSQFQNKTYNTSFQLTCNELHIYNSVVDDDDDGGGGDDDSCDDVVLASFVDLAKSSSNFEQVKTVPTVLRYICRKKHNR